MSRTDVSVAPEISDRRLSRRSVIKAGAHAAWIVPAVQVVGAAPAFASHSAGHVVPPPPPVITGGGATWKPGEVNYMLVTVPIKNPATATAPLTGVTATLTFPADAYLEVHKGFIPSGWTVVSSTATTFVFAYTGVIAPGATITPVFDFKTDNKQFPNGNRPSGTVSVVISSSAGLVSTSYTYAAVKGGGK